MAALSTSSSPALAFVHKPPGTSHVLGANTSKTSCRRHKRVTQDIYSFNIWNT